MTARKTVTKLVAFATALIIAAAGFAAPASAHAQSPDLRTGALSAQSRELTTQSQLKTQVQTDMNTFGIDVSQWQGTINWTKAAKKVKFAIVRCGYGDNVRSQDDRRWLDNVKGCREAGIPMGVYIYSYAKNASHAKSEAKHVARCLKDAGLNASTLELPIYLDMEDSSTNGLSAKKYKSIFNAFKKQLSKSGYTEVGIYSSCSWWDGNLSKIELEPELRWVAHWNKTMCAGYPEVAANGCGMWQYGDAKVSGIKGRVDANYARDDWSYFNADDDESDDEELEASDADAESATETVYKMYKSKGKDYLITTDTDEVANLKKHGWKLKGSLGTVPLESELPVYRFYNGSSKTHYYTTSKVKCNSMRASRKWAYEGIAFYSASKDEGSPVYRLVKSGNYQYVDSKATRKSLIDKSAWKGNGTGWYVLS